VAKPNEPKSNNNFKRERSDHQTTSNGSASDKKTGAQRQKNNFKCNPPPSGARAVKHNPPKSKYNIKRRVSGIKQFQTTHSNV
jgi:hypothetical protein